MTEAYAMRAAPDYDNDKTPMINVMPGVEKTMYQVNVPNKRGPSAHKINGYLHPA